VSWVDHGERTWPSQLSLRIVRRKLADGWRKLLWAPSLAAKVDAPTSISLRAVVKVNYQNRRFEVLHSVHSC
jgi:hypothetical protein